MFYFSSFDEGWKVRPECSVGAFWGCGMPRGNVSFRALSIVENMA